MSQLIDVRKQVIHGQTVLVKVYAPVVVNKKSPTVRPKG